MPHDMTLVTDPKVAAAKLLGAAMVELLCARDRLAEVAKQFPSMKMDIRPIDRGIDEAWRKLE